MCTRNWCFLFGMRRKAVKAESPRFQSVRPSCAHSVRLRLLRRKKFFTPYQTRNHIERIQQIRSFCRRKRLIRFPYRFVLKHRLDRAHAWQDYATAASRLPCILVRQQRRNVLNIQMLQFRTQAQTCEQRFPLKTPAGDDGQKCGLSTTIKCSSICKIFSSNGIRGSLSRLVSDNKTSPYPARTKYVHPTPHHPNRPQNHCSTAYANRPRPQSGKRMHRNAAAAARKTAFHAAAPNNWSIPFNRGRGLLRFFMWRIVTVFHNFSDGISKHN